MTAEEIQELYDEANCFRCFVGGSNADLLRLALLARIVAAVESSGTGTGGSGMVGVVDPEGVVVATPGTSFYNSANFTFWYKTSGVGAIGWQQVV